MRLASLFTALLLITVSACTRGPDETAIREEILDRLNEEFSADLFTIDNLARKGSAPVAGDDALYIYYDSELSFRRDYNLTSWQGLNLGTLAVVLGATPEGIDGFNNNGNKRGDVLKVRGRLRYAYRDGTWTSLWHGAPAQEGAQAETETMEGSGPDAVLEHVRKLVQRTPESTRQSRDSLIIDEFRKSLSRIDLGIAKYDGKLSFGTGWPGGTYNRFGTAFANYASKNGFAVYNYASEGSVENGHQLQAGQLNFALLQSDVAEVLYKGWLEELQMPHPDLRSMASLWPEALHVVTLAANGIDTFSDLEGKRLAIGSSRSGTRFTAIRIWKASELTAPDITQIKEIGLGASIEALESGKVDAIFVAGAIPDPAIQALSQRRQDVRLIPIAQNTIRKLTAEHFAYYEITIPGKTYPGQENPYQTLGFAALLITNRATGDEDVKTFLGLMVEGADVIARYFYRAGFISPDTARLGISVPLHPGAEQFYAERNNNIPDPSE
jgi:TRAP transporter TAXI family solute receptor